MNEQINKDMPFDWAGVLLGTTLALWGLGFIAMILLDLPLIGMRLLCSSAISFAGYIIFRLESIAREPKTTTNLYIDRDLLEAVSKRHEGSKNKESKQ